MALDKESYLNIQILGEFTYPVCTTVIFCPICQEIHSPSIKLISDNIIKFPCSYEIPLNHGIFKISSSKSHPKSPLNTLNSSEYNDFINRLKKSGKSVNNKNEYECNICHKKYHISLMNVKGEITRFQTVCTPCEHNFTFSHNIPYSQSW